MNDRALGYQSNVEEDLKAGALWEIPIPFLVHWFFDKILLPILRRLELGAKKEFEARHSAWGGSQGGK
jgi:hypothetical protein